jgi:putative flippase GtrA
MEKDQKNKNIWLEILRFVIVGGGATLIDFVCEWAIIAIIANRLSSGWTQTIAVTVGFLVSTVFNYLLSLIWVLRTSKTRKKLVANPICFISFCSRRSAWGLASAFSY